MGPDCSQNLAAGSQIGCNCCIKLAVTLNWLFDAKPSQKCDHLFAIDQPAAGQSNVHKSDNLAPGEGLRQLVQLLETPGYVRRVNKCSNRSATNDISLDADFGQGLDNPYMRPSTGRAATQRKSEAGGSHEA